MLLRWYSGEITIKVANMKGSASSSSKRKNPSNEESETTSRKIKLSKEYIVRPAAISNHKSICKVFVNRNVLDALELTAGAFVKVSGIRNAEISVLAMLSSDEAIVDNNIIGVSNELRCLAQFYLGDRVKIAKYNAQPRYAKNVVIGVPDRRPELDSKLKAKIENLLDEIGIISPGLEITVTIKAGEDDIKSKIKLIDILEDDELDKKMEQLSLVSFDHQDPFNDDFIAPPSLFMRNKTKIIIDSACEISKLKYPKLQKSPPFDSIGGLEKELLQLREMINLPLHHPTLFSDFGISPPRGVLLHGPPGTGKTMILNAVAMYVDAHVLSISGSSIVSKYMGDSENSIKEIFQEAKRFQPSIIIMDEVDSLAPSRTSESTSEVDSRNVSTFLSMMDSLGSACRVVVIGATNRINTLDSSLRRPGRFDQEIEISIPDVSARHDILTKIFNNMASQKYNFGTEEIKSISEKTHGYVGADLSALCRESVMRAIAKGVRFGLSYSSLTLSIEDITSTMSEIRPSAMREVVLEMPKVYWSDIGGQEDLKQKLVEVVQLPLESADTFKRLGISAPKGVLLYGPPGCSKTLAAKALATESGINFIAVKGPEIFNKYVGESEKTIREIFRKARAASPSIIFFDEIDAIAESRENSSTSASSNVLTTLLNEIDGIEVLKEVIIVGATNRPTEIDPALLRPGRLDRHIYVKPPDIDARLQILKNCCKKFNLSEDLNLAEFALLTQGCSGAEVTLLCQEAGLAAIKENKDVTSVEKRHFEHALKNISRGITDEMLQYYIDFSSRGGLNI